MSRRQTAVILLSHGSSVHGATDVLCQHAQGIRDHGDFDQVEVAFVNLGGPTLEDATERCVVAGACRIVVVPYFLVSGRFVQDDVAKRVEEAQARWPGVELVAADPLGFATDLVEAVIETAVGAHPVGLRRQSWPPNADPAVACKAWPQTALLIIAHGSPAPGSAADIVRVCDAVRERALFADVRLAFLQHGEPDIPGGIEQCIATGVRRLIAVPYFLLAGKHVTSDVPDLVEKRQAVHPHVEFRLGDFIGRSRCVTRALLARARDAIAG